MASELNSESDSSHASSEPQQQKAVAETSDNSSVPAPESSDPPTPSTSISAPTPTGNATTGAWKAIWSAQYNAYYFYNSSTQETTWVNPLQPADTQADAAVPSTSLVSETMTPASARAEIQAAAAKAAGIDPSLAYLDPTLSSVPGASASAPGYTYTAKFNARTGAFTKPD